MAHIQDRWEETIDGRRVRTDRYGIHAAYLKWRRDHSEDETVRLVREKWLNELCGPTKDTIFFVGDQRDAPRGFLVLGVFWPPAQRPSQQMEHLDLGI